MLQSLSDFISKVTHGETLDIAGQKARWQKVAELTPGLMIAVPKDEVTASLRHLGGGRMDSPEVEGSDVLWDEIVSIRRLPPEQVYDIEVEGTHNFVANRIFAHNTVGKALLTLNETGDQNILTASASGNTVSYIDRSGNSVASSFKDIDNATYKLDPAATGTALALNGDITINDGGANGTVTINAGTASIGLYSSNSTTVCIGTSSCDGKLDAGTIDPPYTINGKKYATYVPSMVGIKEETTGTVETGRRTQDIGRKNEYPSAVIDFRDQEEGSDLWLFSKVTALKKHIGKMTVLLSPAVNARSWYEIDEENMKLTIYTSRPTSVSYRLSAPRFDADKWQNTNIDGPIGHIINDPDQPSTIIDEHGYLANTSLTLTKQEDSAWRLVDVLGNTIEEFLSASQATIANLTAGSIKTDVISPLSSGITLELGPSQTFGIYNKEGSPSAVFDSEGNATFAGTLYADRIVARFGDIEKLQTSTVSAEILDLIARVRDELNAKQEAPTIDATSSALLTLLAQDVATLKSETRDDLLIDSTILIDHTGINTIIDTLYIQPAKLGNLDLMGGTIVVNTLGDVVINGNLAVSGNLSVEGVLGVHTLSSLTDNLTINLASASGSFGRFLVVHGDATISGKLETAELLTKKLSLLADTTATESSRAASFGESFVPSGQTQVTISSTSVTQNSLIFITPTSQTDKTLFVMDKKKEEFTVGISSPAAADIRFNWWIIN